MTISQFISWCVAAITFGTVIMYGCIGETINQKAGDLNLGVPGVMMIGGIASLAAAFLYENNAVNPNPFVSMILTLVATIVASGLAGLLYAFLTVTQKVNQNRQLLWRLSRQAFRRCRYDLSRDNRQYVPCQAAGFVWQIRDLRFHCLLARLDGLSGFDHGLCDSVLPQ